MTKNFEQKNLEEDLKNKPEEDDQKFIKKDGEVTEEEVQEVIDDLKKARNLIKPEANQQRNLDREIGGLEQEEQKESSEKDVWDDRSEEVDKMGSTDTFNSSGMKSAVWKQKQNRLAKKKSEKHHLASAGAALEAKNKMQGGSSFDGMGYVEKLKHLKQDRSTSNNERVM